MKKIIERIEKLEKRFDKYERNLVEKKSKRDLQIAILRLIWKYHGWEGDPAKLADDREDWKQAQEMIDLIKANLSTTT